MSKSILIDKRLHSHSGFPDPFAVATVNGEQTRTTPVIKKTLNPYWNESFDVYACAFHSHKIRILNVKQEGYGRQRTRYTDIRPEEV